MKECLGVLRMAISPYFATLMDPDDPNCPVRKQAVPTKHELEFKDSDMQDPLFEDIDSPTPGLHRYPDRVLFLITDMCGNEEGQRPEGESERVSAGSHHVGILLGPVGVRCGAPAPAVVVWYSYASRARRFKAGCGQGSRRRRDPNGST